MLGDGESQTVRAPGYDLCHKLRAHEFFFAWYGWFGVRIVWAGMLSQELSLKYMQAHKTRRVLMMMVGPTEEEYRLPCPDCHPIFCRVLSLERSAKSENERERERERERDIEREREREIYKREREREIEREDCLSGIIGPDNPTC